MTQPTPRPVPPALQQALDDYDRAAQQLRHRLVQHPNHPDAPAWREALKQDAAAQNGPAERDDG